MKVGNLVYDSHYGNGIVIEILKDEGVVIHFTEAKRVCFLDQQLIDAVEVVSEAR
tara:strand:- start:466 stop:630 length:165 start_codon:yes stop_codon:yes gene_type:complete